MPLVFNAQPSPITNPSGQTNKMLCSPCLQKHEKALDNEIYTNEIEKEQDIRNRERTTSPKHHTPPPRQASGTTHHEVGRYVCQSSNQPKAPRTHCLPTFKAPNNHRASRQTTDRQTSYLVVIPRLQSLVSSPPRPLLVTLLFKQRVARHGLLCSQLFGEVGS